MSQALKSLAGLREGQVEQAKRALSELRAEQVACEHTVAELSRHHARAEKALLQGRLGFAAAGHVSALRLAARCLRAAELDVARSSARLAHARTRLAQARERAHVAEEALRDAEVGRRALDRVLTRRERDRRRIEELRNEAEQEDHYRTRT